MNTIYLILFTSVLTMISSMIGVSILLFGANAQTPTTSDLPATIGNESTSDLGLTNNSLPAQNSSTISAQPPL
jgi:hypothetical protein